MKTINTYAGIFFLLTLSILVLNCRDANAAGSSGKAAKNPVTIDGVVNDTEYAHNMAYSDGAYTLYWRVQKDTAYFAVQAKTTGWVAVGFNPDTKMLHADIYMGWVDSTGKAFTADMFSTGEMGPHAPDIEQGGKDNILDFAGTESDGTTTIEFSRKLDTGDTMDQVLDPSGNTKIIWAYGADDDDTVMHSLTSRGSDTIVLDGGTPVASAGTTDTNRELEAGAEKADWPVHAGFMFLGFIAITSGVMTARLKKKEVTG